MQLFGVGLGAVVALVWRSADILATHATRRLRTFKTTFVSQSTGLLALLTFGILAFYLWHLPFTLTALALSALIGIFTGLFAALGYFAFYRALEIGPVAIVSPLTATSSTFTLILSTIVLQEQLTLGRIGFVSIVILGIILASTSLVEIRKLLAKPGYSLWSPGVRWAIVATLAFGAMDFGIGASASLSGWFLPVLWTRVFSILFLTLISYWKRRRRDAIELKPASPVGTVPCACPALKAPTSALVAEIASPIEKTLSLSLPSLVEIGHLRNPFSKIGLGVLLAVLARIVENAAVLTFSLDTRITTTGISSVITSSYALVVIVFGMIAYHERLAKNQIFGIGLFMVGLFLLAL